MLRPGHIIALCVIALLTIGVIMVNSAGMRVHIVGAEQGQDPGITAQSVILSRTTIYMGLAITAMLIGAYLPVRGLANALPTARPGALRPIAVLAVGVVGMLALCALVYIPGLQRHVNGQSRWIEIPGIGEGLSVQPSELAKWGMLVLMAW